MTCFIWSVALKVLLEQWSSYVQDRGFMARTVHLPVTGALGSLLGLGSSWAHAVGNSGYTEGYRSEASAAKCLRREMHLDCCGLLAAAALNSVSPSSSPGR